MKKIIIYFLLLFFVISTILYINKNNKQNNSINKIRLAEVTHSVFYTPLYVAIEKNYFKENNLDIELILTPGADKVSSAVLSNDVEIGLAGAESAVYIYNQHKKDYLEIFSGLTKRDGQFILSKTTIKDFKMEDLYGKEILVGRLSGMPALNFLNALKNSGVDKNKININYSVDFSALSGAFIGGQGDFVNLFEPNATKIENKNLGYVVQSIGELSGPMPYTVFYAKKSYIKNNKEIISQFIDSINKALKYVKENNEQDIAKIISNQFPESSLEELEIIIKRYKEADSWLDNYYISEELFKNLEDLLMENELIKDPINYQKIFIQ